MPNPHTFTGDPNFLIYFCQDSRKTARKAWVERRRFRVFNSIKRGNQNSSTSYYQIDYQYDTFNTTFFQNSFQKLYRVIKGQGH